MVLSGGVHSRTLKICLRNLASLKETNSQADYSGDYKTDKLIKFGRNVFFRLVLGLFFELKYLIAKYISHRLGRIFRTSEMCFKKVCARLFGAPTTPWCTCRTVPYLPSTQHGSAKQLLPPAPSRGKFVRSAKTECALF